MELGEPFDRIYAKHQGMIGSLIRSIIINNRSVVSIADLQQVGAMALIIAIKSYDPSLGSLKSYIRKCIRHALLAEANAFGSVFTVDEKTRRQANAAKRMQDQGLRHSDIMTMLGIKTHATLESLLKLTEDQAVSFDQIEILAPSSMEEQSLISMLDDIGLSKEERRLVDLIMDSRSIEEIENMTGMNKVEIARARVSISDKITHWGKI
jgi:RNA polymerase sigma factor (sigma-70 family)